jgi:hypothetical protein
MILFILPGTLPGFERDDKFFIDTFDKDWVWGKLGLLSQRACAKEYKAKALIVCDDIITEIERSGKDKAIEDLIFRRRWLFPNVEVSWVVASQYFNLVPRKFRLCYTHVILFNLPPIEFSQISKFYAFVKHQDSKFDLMRIHLSKKHNFVLFHLDESLIFLNFQTVL